MSDSAPAANEPARPVSEPVQPSSLYASPNALAPHYSAFRVADRLLLTGHSHQAWPDVAFEGQKRAWLDAAELADEKWARAFAAGEAVRRGYAALLGDDVSRIALAPNTHDLVVRFLSALPLRDRPKLVTTDGEFHTIRRQLDRLEEEGIEIGRVPAEPADTLSERIAAAVDDRTSAALVSSVMFRDARIVPGLRRAMEGCERVGALLLVDAYHALDAIPVSLEGEGLTGAYIVGGGYKYCQLGEGNCFLRFPEGCELRPVVTGWFSEFAALEAAAGSEGAARPPVAYGPGPDRFAGSTYDPTSHYRAAEVFRFFAGAGLTPDLLREVSRHQIGLLAAGFDTLDLDPELIARDRDVPLAQIAGFLALRTPRARELCVALRERGVLADHRDRLLRLGPAPYLSDAQVEAAVEALGEAARSLA